MNQTYNSGKSGTAKTARDQMTRHVTCLLPNDAVSDIHDLMRDLGVRHLPVVEGGRLVGLVSDRDVLLHARRSPDGIVFDQPLKARDLMTTSLITCSADARLGDIADRMIALKVDAMPVVQSDGRLVGLVTSTDLLEFVRSRFEDTLEQVMPFEFRLRIGTGLPDSVT